MSAVARDAILTDMQIFVTTSMSASPKTKKINGKIVRPLNDGKSGAHVFEMENNRVLKLYPKCTDPTELHFQRSLRDIMMTCITPDEISPHVYDYGISRDMRPFMIMEKIDGTELFCYRPCGGAHDIKLLDDIVKALMSFNSSFRHFCQFYGVGTFQPCHRDLHPHNIFVTADGVRFIDFDLAVCPLRALCDSDSPQRQRALHHPWLQYVIGNYLRGTEEYVHWTNVLDHVPTVVRNDSDMMQLYAIFRYFERYNPHLKNVNVKLRSSTCKKNFLNIAHRELNIVYSKLI